MIAGETGLVYSGEIGLSGAGGVLFPLLEPRPRSSVDIKDPLERSPWNRRGCFSGSLSVWW